MDLGWFLVDFVEFGYGRNVQMACVWLLDEHLEMVVEGLKGVQNGSQKLEDVFGRGQHGSKWSKDGQQVAPGGAKVAPGCLK